VMQPIRYVKAHPLATSVAFIGGMLFGQSIFGAFGRVTGINLPTSVNGNGG
jgi:hypothetical protein